MADKSKIEWTDATWNPIVGCSVLSPGCKHCYAMRDAWRIQHNPRTSHYDGLTERKNGGPPVWTGHVRLVPQVLEKPLSWQKPRRVFVNSMGDVFHEDVPFEWIDMVFAVMASAPRHQFQLLTKRADRMHYYMASRRRSVSYWEKQARMLGYTFNSDGIALLPFPPPNIWLGVSVEDKKRKDRIDALRTTPAAVRFLSLEPLLEGLGDLDLKGIHWVIVGGESGPRARPMRPVWARLIRDQCAAAGVPFHFKQWGNWLDGQNVGKKRAGRLLDGVEHNGMPS